MKIDVLYEDNHVLIVNKPAGLLTQPAENVKQSLEAYAKAYIKEKYQKPGAVFLHAVHRLDKPVSGIVLFAKTSKALSRINEMQREHKIKKWYMALVRGKIEKTKGTLQHTLAHESHRAKEALTGKVSTLDYEVIEYKNGFSLLEITLETGRYHQIRAQLAAISHPIVGDAKYGSSYPFEKDAIALHHFKIALEHPVTKAPLCIEALPHWGLFDR